MASLYNISEDLKQIFAELEDNGGELTPELEEAMAFTQEEFRAKIENYAHAVRQLEGDLALIKEEKARIAELQKSKEKTIERLKGIMAKAVSTFGDTSKTGTKFIDYGTGKISLRRTESVNVDTDVTDRFVNRFMSCLKWYDMQNQLNRSILNEEDILNYINEPTLQETEDNVVPVKFNLDDCNNLSLNINANVNFKDVLTKDTYFDVVKALIKLGAFDVNSKVDKMAIKREAKDNQVMPIYATLDAKETVTIK